MTKISAVRYIQPPKIKSAMSSGILPTDIAAFKLKRRFLVPVHLKVRDAPAYMDVYFVFCRIEPAGFILAVIHFIKPVEGIG